MNTVAVIHVDAINSTPRGKSEKLRESHEADYMSGSIALPPWAKVAVLSAHLQPGRLSGAPTLTLMPVGDFFPETVAKRENGTIQKIADRRVVLSPSHGYIGQPARGILAVSDSVSRQDFSRWLVNATEPDKPAIGDWLAKAAATPAHIVFAVDVSDMFNPAGLRMEFEQTKVEMTPDTMKDLVQMFETMQGLIFTANVNETLDTETRLKFRFPVARFLPTLKLLLPKIMDESGLAIHEIRTATVTADGNDLVITGPIGRESLGRVLSLVRSPGDVAGSADGKEVSTSANSTKEIASRTASMRYYASVNKLIDDLRRAPAAKTDIYYENSALWYDTFADRISRLSIQNIDPEVVRYASSSAEKLRSMAGTLRGLKSQLNAFDSYATTVTTTNTQVVGTGLYGLDWWGNPYTYGRGQFGVVTGNPTGFDSNVAAVRTRQAELAAGLAPEREKTWAVLRSDRQSLRVKMQQKYMTDFDAVK